MLNSQPIPQEPMLEIFQHNFGKSKILSWVWGVPKRGQKWPFFGHFQVRRVSFHPMDTINSDLGAKMGLLPRVGHNRNNLKAFSHNFCFKIFRYSANFDLRVTQFGAISVKKCLSVAYFTNYSFQNSPMMHFCDIYHENCSLEGI